MGPFNSPLFINGLVHLVVERTLEKEVIEWVIKGRVQ